MLDKKLVNKTVEPTIKTVTHCPTCKSEVNVVDGPGGTVNYEPVTQNPIKAFEKINTELVRATIEVERLKNRNRYLQAKVEVLESHLKNSNQTVEKKQ